MSDKVMIVAGGIATIIALTRLGMFLKKRTSENKSEPQNPLEVLERETSQPNSLGMAEAQNKALEFVKNGTTRGMIYWQKGNQEVVFQREISIPIYYAFFSAYTLVISYIFIGVDSPCLPTLRVERENSFRFSWPGSQTELTEQVKQQIAENAQTHRDSLLQKHA